MDAEFPVRVGELLAGKYRLEGVIGSGGMGVVFAANHLELQRRVAIKLLRPNQCDHEGSVARLIQEARAVARLNGPNVAKMLDVGRLESGLPYLVMELLEGRNLHDVVREQGPVSIVQAVDYVLQACEAVAEAHRVGVVHRDLKPANLFLTRDPYGEPLIKVLDFGISKILVPIDPLEGGLTDSRCMIGSPVYMSPEQMQSARDVDHRCDIWGLGTILFELLAGRTVWSGQTFSDLSAQILRDPCPRLSELRPEVSPELAAVVERCLRKDPLARFQRVSDLALALACSASESGRAAARHVLKVAGQAHVPALAVTSSPPSVSTEDPLSTANALPATALTRLTRRARARVVPAVIGAGVVLIGWRVLSSHRGSADTEHRALSAHAAASAPPQTELATGGAGGVETRRGSENSRAAARAAPLSSSSARSGASVTPAQVSSGPRRSPNQSSKRDATTPEAQALSTVSRSTTEPALAPSVDPMRLRTLAPKPVDPMSIRK